MKQKLLFLYIGLFISTQLFSQEVPSPPPPCGLSASYVCDEDMDGFVTINLLEWFPFINCAGVVLDNFSVTYHLTESDQIDGVNPIPNPESYVLSSSDTYIFYKRGVDINDGEIALGQDDVTIIIPPTPNIPTPLYVCDYDSDGYALFNLYQKRTEILSGQGEAYSLSFYETFEDAQSLVNPLNVINYSNTMPYQQTIYGAVYAYGNGWDNSTFTCVEIVPLDLIAGECEDLEVNLLSPNSNPRPGFNYTNRLFIQNLGSTAITSGIVQFSYDSNLTLEDIVSSDNSYTIIPTSNGFQLIFNDLEYLEEDFIDITLYCPPSVPLGTLLTNTANYLTNSNDVNISNDSSTLTETVIGSYDPNDKMESRGSDIIIDDFAANDYLYYTIRFQNVGTADAINIRIEDELNNQIDESSFQMIRASHNYNVSRIGNHLSWQFNNINLPAESEDEVGSNGFVYFKVKLKPGFGIGNIIPNNAAIYFDFNDPIITNTFVTHFVSTLSDNNYNTTNYKIYPNPAKDVVNIQFNGSFIGVADVEIYDIQGKLILSKAIISNQSITQLHLSNFESGMYFMKLKTNDSETTKKLIIE